MGRGSPGAAGIQHIVCTVIISTTPGEPWPLLLAANRDERLDRVWEPPGRHWPTHPHVMGPRDVPGGGSWLAVSDGGVVAAVLNRVGSLGPAPGKRSRGELPLIALAEATAEATPRRRMVSASKADTKGLARSEA